MSIDRSSSPAGITRWAVAGVVLLSIIAGIVAGLTLASRPAPDSVAALRLSLPPAPVELVRTGSDFPFGLALAADGRRMVFSATAEGVTQLWLRDLRTDSIEPLRGTDDGVLPFWSAADDAIGYFAGGQLRAYMVGDGTARELADAPVPRGGAWHPNGDIIFAGSDSGLSRRRADGTVEVLTSLESGETSHRLPRLLHDGRHVVFFVTATERVREGIWIAALDDPASRRRLTSSDAEGLPVGDTLLYASGGALVAQRVDLDRLALAGRPLLLGRAVGQGPQHQLFATAGGDVLVFGMPVSTLRQLQWVDRAGQRLGTLGEPMQSWDVRIAPRASTVAITRADPQLDTLDIWTYDDGRPLPRRVSPNIDVDEAPAWSPDGARLAWVSGRRVVTVRDARATTPDVALRKYERSVRVTDWSPDARWLVVSASSASARSDLFLLRATEGGEQQPYVHSPFDETHGVVSPDGRWLAYASDESGRTELYADTFPAPSQRARLTVGGGTEPRWSQDGREIFFRRGSEIHVVRLGITATAIEAVSSERLFDVGADIRSFDITATAERFLLNLPAADAEPQPLTVIVNLSAVLEPPAADQ